MGDVLADLVHNAGSFVAEEERVGVLDVAVAVGQVRVAHAGGLDLDHHIVGAGFRDHNVHDLDRGALGTGDYSLNSLCHAPKTRSGQ